MNIVLWVLQILLALAFFAHGLLFLIPPADIAARAGEIWAIVGDTARWFGYAQAREGVGVVA